MKTVTASQTLWHAHMFGVRAVREAAARILAEPVTLADWAFDRLGERVRQLPFNSLDQMLADARALAAEHGPHAQIENSGDSFVLAHHITDLEALAAEIEPLRKLLPKAGRKAA